MANIEELRIVENINAKYGQVNAERLPVMTGNYARLNRNDDLVNVLFAATISRGLASICLLTNYFIMRRVTRRPGMVSLAGWRYLDPRRYGCQAIRVLRRGGCVALRW